MESVTPYTASTPTATAPARKTSPPVYTNRLSGEALFIEQGVDTKYGKKDKFTLSVSGASGRKAYHTAWSQGEGQEFPSLGKHGVPSARNVSHGVVGIFFRASEGKVPYCDVILSGGCEVRLFLNTPKEGASDEDADTEE